MITILTSNTPEYIASEGEKKVKTPIYLISMHFVSIWAHVAYISHAASVSCLVKSPHKTIHLAFPHSLPFNSATPATDQILELLSKSLFYRLSIRCDGYKPSGLFSN
jgi:hypothetical protein